MGIVLGEVAAANTAKAAHHDKNGEQTLTLTHKCTFLIPDLMLNISNSTL